MAQLPPVSADYLVHSFDCLARRRCRRKQRRKPLRRKTRFSILLTSLQIAPQTISPQAVVVDRYGYTCIREIGKLQLDSHLASISGTIIAKLYSGGIAPRGRASGCHQGAIITVV